MLGLGSSQPYEPPGAWYFKVQMVGSFLEVDANFSEISGIGAEFGIEEIQGGGENRYNFKLPTPVKHSNLVLKRGLVTKLSPLAIWVHATLTGDLLAPILPNIIRVTLMRRDGATAMSWNFINAYPVKWSVSDFKSTDNAVAIETLEFAYKYYIPLPI